MRTTRPDTLGKTLHAFFQEYLPRLRGTSPHTVLSYRDSLKLLLGFLAQATGKAVADLDVADVDAAKILAFLDSLETDRGNGVGTRNVRLAAIHTLFRYLAAGHPEYVEQCQRILNIPFKRAACATIEYLEFEEMAAVLQAVDRSDAYGLRDYALLSLMFNTGARAQEMSDLKATDLQLLKPLSVRIYGKGKKERICPLWPQTASVVRDHVAAQGIDLRKPVPVFTNHLGGTLTRFGVRYILAKYVRMAANTMPSLKRKKLHPHSVRHSTALYLLKSGVDIATVSHWLGHRSVNTTNKYAEIDLDMKRQALENAQPPDEKRHGLPSWRRDPDLLRWLDSL